MQQQQHLPRVQGRLWRFLPWLRRQTNRGGERRRQWMLSTLGIRCWRRRVHQVASDTLGSSLYCKWAEQNPWWILPHQEGHFVRRTQVSKACSMRQPSARSRPFLEKDCGCRGAMEKWKRHCFYFVLVFCLSMGLILAPFNKDSFLQTQMRRYNWAMVDG